MTSPLTHLPPEIWLQVLSHLSEPDFLALRRTSPYLAAVISTNAATICNNRILTCYAREAVIIGTTVKDGWLVPTHPAIRREEKNFFRARHPARVRSRAWPPRPPPLDPRVRTRLSEPGPQYLRFLVEYAFEIRVANVMFLEGAAQVDTSSSSSSSSSSTSSLSSSPSSSSSCCCEIEPQEKFDRWIGLYLVRKFLNRLQGVAGQKAAPRRGYPRTGPAFKQEESMLERTQEGLAWFYP